MREVKYAVVTMVFVVDSELPADTRPMFLTLWPGGSVELNGDGRRGIGASKVSYRYRPVRDPGNVHDLAGEALAVVLRSADGEDYEPGDYESLRAWHDVRAYECEHGHDPARCSQCVLQYSPPEEA